MVVITQKNRTKQALLIVFGTNRNLNDTVVLVIQFVFQKYLFVVCSFTDVHRINEMEPKRSYSCFVFKPTWVRWIILCLLSIIICWLRRIKSKNANVFELIAVLLWSSHLFFSFSSVSFSSFFFSFFFSHIYFFSFSYC